MKNQVAQIVGKELPTAVSTTQLTDHLTVEIAFWFNKLAKDGDFHAVPIQVNVLRDGRLLSVGWLLLHTEMMTKDINYGGELEIVPDNADPVPPQSEAGEEVQA